MTASLNPSTLTTLTVKPVPGLLWPQTMLVMVVTNEPRTWGLSVDQGWYDMLGGSLNKIDRKARSEIVRRYTLDTLVELILNRPPPTPDKFSVKHINQRHPRGHLRQTPSGSSSFLPVTIQVLITARRGARPANTVLKRQRAGQAWYVAVNGKRLGHVDASLKRRRERLREVLSEALMWQVEV